MKSYHWVWIVAVVLLVFGIWREDLAYIFNNASMICFSCIGLG